MVLDNNDADLREGVEPTYKKVIGFQPLQVIWGHYLIDAIFRNGKGYCKDVSHIFFADTGFSDQAFLEYCDKHDVGLIVGGKLYQEIKDDLDQMLDNSFQEF